MSLIPSHIHEALSNCKVFDINSFRRFPLTWQYLFEILFLLGWKLSILSATTPQHSAITWVCVPTSDKSVNHFNLVGSCRGFLLPERGGSTTIKLWICLWIPTLMLSSNFWMAASSYSLVLIIVLHNSYETFIATILSLHFFIASLKLGSFTTFFVISS